MSQAQNSIFEELYLRDFNRARLIDWAIAKMREGCESEHLLILASLAYESDAEEILRYFYEALRELNIAVPNYRLDVPTHHIAYLINAVNKGYLSAQTTLDYLSSAYSESGQKDDYLPYYEVANSIDLYLFENPVIFKRQTNCDSLHEYLLTEINRVYNSSDQR